MAVLNAEKLVFTFHIQRGAYFTYLPVQIGVRYISHKDIVD
jgi:hypothetical protein